MPLLFLLIMILNLSILYDNSDALPQPQFVDGTASGTVLQNLMGRRKKRCLFADALTSGTVLGNPC